MRASRLVSLLLLLQTRGQLTAAELAQELEVSVRTVHRDVEALTESGVPIYAERGPHGGIRLVDGYRTRLTGHDPRRGRGAVPVRPARARRGARLGTVVAAARLKVLAALPTELRARATRLVERFHLDASGWFQADEPVPQPGGPVGGGLGGSPGEIDYDRGDVVERVLEPLGLVLKAGDWYLVAASDGQIRTYRVSRVSAVTVHEERGERPEAFDLAAYWAESSAAYERDTPRLTATVRVRRDRTGALASAVGHRIVDAAERLDVPDPDDWLHLRIRLEWPDEAAASLLAAGSHVEVLEPAELRDRVVALAARILERYRTGEPERAD